MNDWEEYDDNKLKELEKRLKKIYRQAYRESQEKVDRYFKLFAEEDEEMRKLYLEGKITKDEYRAWRQKKMLSGKHWTDLRDQVVERIHDANKTAEQIINDETPKTYTRNYNHAQYEGDVNVGVSFELTNENAVKQALKSNHVTFKTVKINDSKDTRYTQERLTNELVSGIVQGKTWRELAKSYQNVLNGSYSQAVRSARTSYTSAQNSGRLDSFERFERAGIKVLKEWMSTKDERTRESHAQLNGVRVAVKEKFPNGLLYPGDPEGSPCEVYNCRCKLVSFFPGSSRDRGLGNTVETYEKWLKAKNKDINIAPSKTHLELASQSVYYNAPKQLKINETKSDEIVKRIAGGDKTKGSCSSVALAYIANRNGLDVRDYRGGKSQDIFSHKDAIIDIATLTGVKSFIEEDYNDFKAVNKLIKNINDEKEYYLATGRHASIIKKDSDGKLLYLELQANRDTDNGWNYLTSERLKNRFKCQKTHTVLHGRKYTVKSVLIESESLGESREFQNIVGYINTDEDKQLKGKGGNAK